MRDLAIGIHTIGQTPRPDLVDRALDLPASTRLLVRGALDGMDAARIPPCPVGGYPLETRLRDGTSVVVDAAFVEPRLQRAIEEVDDGVGAHLVLCAGSFPSLGAHSALVLPFDATVAELRRQGVRSLEIVVPFVAQAAPALRKWSAAGFDGRAHVLASGPAVDEGASQLAHRLAGTDADAVVLDYVGLSPSASRTLRDSLDVAVFDVGEVARDALHATLAGL
jgi:hypothetical protein